MTYIVRAIAKQTGWIREQVGPFDTHGEAATASQRLRDMFRTITAEPSFSRERTLADQHEFRILEIDDTPSGQRTEHAA